MASSDRFATAVALAIVVFSTATQAQAQTPTIDLAMEGAEQVWRGVEPGARAGLWLDQGPLSLDGRRDLIVGAPGDGATLGHVYVLFGGPVRTGAFDLTTAETVLAGAAAGDLFGTSTAAGNILNTDGTFPRNLVVGAPGAFGGRGAVYLFAAGFGHGNSLTTTNAVLTIVGNTGDAIGTALATADLNEDNHREIVIGAPGTGRIYIINGAPSLSGTIDLATEPASSVITGTGIGHIVTAGEVTGDGVYDLLIAAPEASNSRGVVYLVAGMAGSGLPASVSLPSGATAAFAGNDANDFAGSSVRIGDIDADGRQDIIIGAPGGDGPGGSRTDAGEAYILWGSAAYTSLNLSAAPVTIFGDAPSARLGAYASAGDINRDTPNDIVLLAPGPAASTGQLTVYYGRSRGSIGVLQPGGVRYVDFAQPGQMDRRIVSDPTAGPLVSAQVYEVTGEGARDIIVSSPYAMTESGHLSGYVYFTISAKLAVSQSSIQVGAVQGGNASTSFEVRDKSSVEISWSAASNVPWLTVSPSFGMAVEDSPATVTISASGPGLAPGSYSGTLTVSSTSRELEMSLPVTVAFNILSAPTITTNTTFPAEAGTPLTFTAGASGGTGAFQYQFWRYEYGVGWAMVQDYSSDNQYAWTPAAGEVGDYVIQAWVRSLGSSASVEAYASTDRLAITPAVPHLVSFTASVMSPAAPGTPITWTAETAGGAAPLEYKFWRYKVGVGWTVARNWATTPTHTWTPGISDQGSYSIQVWVRNGGSTDDDPGAWQAMDFTISSSTPVIHAFSADKAPVTGTPVTWTALASGGTTGPLQYRFWRYSATTQLWTVVQDYSADNTFTWTPGYGDVGTYVMQVWVRSTGSSASHEAYASTDYFPITRSAVTITSFTSDRAFPASTATPVTWTAEASGGSGTLEYKFWRYKAGSGWTIVQDFSSTNTFTWTPGPGGAGSYAIQVWVRTAGAPASHEAYAAMEFTIQ